MSLGINDNMSDKYEFSGPSASGKPLPLWEYSHRVVIFSSSRDSSYAYWKYPFQYTSKIIFFKETGNMKIPYPRIFRLIYKWLSPSTSKIRR